MTRGVAFDRKYCICCGERRDEDGQTTHDFECIWYKSIDLDYINEFGERVETFVPYDEKQR